MAVDKLVDSTQLDADLTSVANAIRTKGGTSAELAFPQGFVNAIEDIPSGSDSLTLNTYQAGFTGQKLIISDFYDSIIFNMNVGGAATDVFNAAHAFMGMTANKLTINMEKGFISIANYMIANAEVPVIEFNVNSSRMSSAGGFLDNCSTISLTGTPFDYSSIPAGAGYMTPFIGCRQLEYVRFVANTIPRSLNFKDCISLDADSFVSIANGLNENYSYNVQFPTSKQSLVQSTMGNVVDGLFVADASGTTSLADFITTTKGWVIAWA